MRILTLPLMDMRRITWAFRVMLQSLLIFCCILALPCVEAFPQTPADRPDGGSTAGAREGAGADKTKFLVIDSYHKEYNWSKETHRGFCASMHKLGYFDSEAQVSGYLAKDAIETSKAVIKRIWLDAKRKNIREDQGKIKTEVALILKEFQPDLVFLGDDDAAQYTGEVFLDAPVLVVFWGIDNTPVKYGLIDSDEKPGHNVTGVYQTGYYADSLALLKKIVPRVKTFGVLSDESSTGRAKVKAIEYLNRKGALPLQHVETVSTGDYDEWKRQALALQEKVDAFYMAMWSSLKDKDGKYVANDDVARWYLANIKIPEATMGEHFVRQGLLCTANDSGFKQGFEAVLIAHDLLTKGANPATYPPRSPSHGALIANRQRATKLGITLTPEMGIEEIAEEASALK